MRTWNEALRRNVSDGGLTGAWTRQEVSEFAGAVGYAEARGVGPWT